MDLIQLLTAQGLLGLPFTWGPNGVESYGPAITPEQKAKIELVFATFVPDTEFDKEKAIELAKFRADRREMFALIGDMGFIALATNDAATAAALVVFRQGVADLPAWPAVVAATTIEGLKAAMSARYKSLTNALPTNVKLMFKELAS